MKSRRWLKVLGFLGGLLLAVNVFSASAQTGELPPTPTIPTDPYAVVNPSGCLEVKGAVRIRIDMYLGTDSPDYLRYRVNVIDESSPAFLAGYKGEVDDFGNPLDLVDYNKWWDSLPRVWQDNPFHCAFLTLSPSLSDDAIRQEINKTLGYFYAFHKATWDAGFDFLDEWKRVPVGSPFRSKPVIGSPNSKADSLARVEDIKSRAGDFTATTEPDSTFTLPQGEQTIDVGPGATDRSTTNAAGGTVVAKDNPANATGEIDTFEVWAATNMTGTNEVGLFSASGDNLTTTDYEAIGEVTAGSKQTFTGLSISVTSGDYLGFYWSVGTIEKDSSGGGGVWFKAGDNIPCTGAAFTPVANQVTSLYATGTEPPPATRKPSVIIF